MSFQEKRPQRKLTYVIRNHDWSTVVSAPGLPFLLVSRTLSGPRGHPVPFVRVIWRDNGYNSRTSLPYQATIGGNELGG